MVAGLVAMATVALSGCSGGPSQGEIKRDEDRTVQAAEIRSVIDRSYAGTSREFVARAVTHIDVDFDIVTLRTDWFPSAGNAEDAGRLCRLVAVGAVERWDLALVIVTASGGQRLASCETS